MYANGEVVSGVVNDFLGLGGVSGIMGICWVECQYLICCAVGV